jgi:hypothetical protein
METRGPDRDAESLASFAECVGHLMKTCEDIKSWFDALDLDDYFGSAKSLKRRCE